MVKTILYRLFYGLVVLFIITYILFLIIEKVDSNYASIQEGEKTTIVKQLFENKPGFYFSIVPSNFSDSIFRIKEQEDFEVAKSLIYKGHLWRDINQLLSIKQKWIERWPYKMEIKSIVVKPGLSIFEELKNLPDSFLSEYDKQQILVHEKSLQSNKSFWRLLIPKLKWNGKDNRYHHWIVTQLSPATVSKIDNRPVWDKIKEALSWTLFLNLIAITLVYIIGIKLGEILFVFQKKRSAKFIDTILVFFHTIPVFFLGMILIYLFASSTISPALKIFPTPGFWDIDPAKSFFQNVFTYFSALVLPLLCIVLPSLAFLVRLIITKIEDETNKRYVFQSLSEGKSWPIIIRTQIRKNILFPIVILIGLEIPLLISGSVVLEVLFNIPGMGRLIYQSILGQDWAVVFSVLILICGITVMGKWISDIGMHFLDRRINIIR